MAHFKFMLDEGVSGLRDCFPKKRVITMELAGLSPDSPDSEVIAYASEHGHVMVAANRRDFVREAERHIAQSSKKPFGCCRVQGMILLVPNEEFVQRRVLRGLESRLSLDGQSISFADVHDRDLLVTVDEQGKANVTRLPRCRHCQYPD